VAEGSNVKDRQPTPQELARFEAEAAKFLAEADRARADITLSEKQAEEQDVSTQIAQERLKGAVFEVETMRVNTDQLLRNEMTVLAQNEHHHVYLFSEQVSESSVKKCISQLTTWSRNDPECDIEININSPGGSIVDGFALIDFVADLQSKGHKITTVALGMAASMGGVILQAGTKRIMGKNAFLLIHEGSLGAVGDYGEVEDRVKFMKLLHEHILDLFVGRSNVTKAFIRKNWARTDWWIDSEEALKHGFIDEIQ
jgi:ATP-dependent Clp endopeptidase proteolytic subunit ClpP